MIPKVRYALRKPHKRQPASKAAPDYILLISWVHASLPKELLYVLEQPCRYVHTEADHTDDSHNPAELMPLFSVSRIGQCAMRISLRTL